MGVDIVVKRALVNHVGALQLLDGDQELLARRGVKVVVIAEGLAIGLLAHDIATLIEQRAFCALGRSDHQLGQVSLFVKGVVLAAAVASLDGRAVAVVAVQGRIVDRLPFALALLQGKAQHVIVAVGIIHRRLGTLAALDRGLGEQALIIEDEHVVALGAVGHDDLFVHAARAAVETHVMVLDAVTVRRVVHQIGIKQSGGRVNARGVDVGGEFLEGYPLTAQQLVLGVHRRYRRQADHGQQ